MITQPTRNAFDTRVRGNVLFIILLGIILFAALGYAVTHSMQGGGGNAVTEKHSLTAARMLGQAATIENHINRMLLDGIPKEQLEFRANPVVYPNTANSNCASDKCRVFTINGGKLVAEYFPREALDPNYKAFDTQAAHINTATGQIKPWFLITSVKDIGTTAPDIVLSVDYLSPEVCEEINVQEGVLKRGDPEPTIMFTDAGVHFNYFTGNQSPWPTGLQANVLGGSDARLAGKRAFCIRSTNSHLVGRRFIYVLHGV